MLIEGQGNGAVVDYLVWVVQTQMELPHVDRDAASRTVDHICNYLVELGYDVF